MAREITSRKQIFCLPEHAISHVSDLDMRMAQSLIIDTQVSHYSLRIKSTVGALPFAFSRCNMQPVHCRQEVVDQHSRLQSLLAVIFHLCCGCTSTSTPFQGLSSVLSSVVLLKGWLLLLAASTTGSRHITCNNSKSIHAANQAQQTSLVSRPTSLLVFGL